MICAYPGTLTVTLAALEEFALFVTSTESVALFFTITEPLPNKLVLDQLTSPVPVCEAAMPLAVLKTSMQ